MADNKENSYLTDDEIGGLKVPGLKDYLRKHGQYVTGNKSNLIERAKGVRKLKLNDVTNVQCDDAARHTERYKEKLTTSLGEKIPEPISLKNWLSDVTNIPDFSDSETYNYLVLTMKATRQFRSRVYFEDRHVHSVEYHPVSDDCSHCLVRCKVIPSLPTSNKKDNPDHTVWVCLSKVSSKVHSANCDCTAGNGEACNHITALLCALEDISVRRKDGTLSSTSQKCKWNNPRKRKLSPKKVQDLKFNKFRSTHLVQGEDATCTGDKSVSSQFKQTVDVERVKKKLLSANSNAGWLTFYSTEKTCPSTKDDTSPRNLVPKLHDVCYMYHDTVDFSSDKCQKDFQSKFDSMAISSEDVANVEKLTNGQNKNDMWYEARKERITSSEFGNVCKLKPDTNPENTVKNILGYKTFESKYCNWGISHEPAARRMYINSLRNEPVSVKTCGLLLNPNYPHLGASPDGLVNSMCVNDTMPTPDDGLLEIKCPASKKWKHKHPTDCADDKDFFCYKASDNAVKLKKSHKYFYQVQGQMLISERKWCDFMVWTLKGWTVERIYFDKEFCCAMLLKLNCFYVKNIIPEIFSLRVKRGVVHS